MSALPGTGTCYRLRAYERCALTGMSIHRECIYTTSRWVAEHLTLSTPALDEQPHASVEDLSSNTDPRRYAQ